MKIVEEILEAESRLREAMLNGDTDALDRLIADRVLFAGPDGRLLTKAEDLRAHRERVLQVSALEFRQPAVVQVSGTVAVCSVEAILAGTYAGSAFQGSFRYMRVWALEDAGWQVVAAQCTALQGAVGG
jgi:ketosteroid isomerase-like protein